ncbi:MAG: alanine racemase [Geminicoccaceae bacterium]
MRPAQARIDLAALRHNLARVRACAPAAGVVAMVKANGYGNGAARLLPALHAADRLGVACLEEALVLRAAGARQPIVLIEGVFSADELAACGAHGLEIVVHEQGQIAMLEQAAPAEPLALWLKIDTGMTRLGLAPGAVHDAYHRLKRRSRSITLTSHFACADEPDNSMTRAQIARFDAVCAGLEGARSLANSAGVLAWPASHRDHVRPGIMLYGASPMIGHTGADDGLLPVMTLQTGVVALKDIPAGTSVGYGATWTAAQASRIAIAAIGYGDGYPRHAPSGTPVLVNGQRAGLAGRVSMDLIAIDVTGLADVAIGDPVTLWGEGLPVEEVAEAAGTIAYELLCGVTQRVPVSTAGP